MQRGSAGGEAVPESLVTSDVRARPTLVALAAATLFGGIGLAAGGTAGGVLGADLGGTDAAAGLPLGLLVAGSAGAALVISRSTESVGRARSLMFGYLVGALGALVVVLATAAGAFVLLLLGSPLLGAANASLFLTRYAAAEVGGDAMRGQALGVVLAATAIGAVASPTLMGPSGEVARILGLPPLSGLYLVAAVAFPTAALVLGVTSSTRTPRLAPAAGVPAPDVGLRGVTRRHVVDGLRPPRTRVALFELATTNLVMVAVMAIAPVHLVAHGVPIGVIGVVISIHVAGMFAPSPMSGWLADRIGPATVAGLGSAVLVGAAVAGTLVPRNATAALSTVLVLLGVGWNLGVVGASTALVVSVPVSLRPRVEGIGEFAMGLAAAVGAPLAGIVAAVGGMMMLWVVGAAIAASALIVAAVSMTRTAQAPAA
ncbi:MAG: hypothetical protein M3360_03365 [Actinomycetota bacterium]|nr:hypothetical protein [Actinomycetota bacterium]